ncbi:hypothetical protein GGF46_001662 [Coemansia sp. RSA 552]|nr:hypothetical protein GGF46_001662 [Coemansia sp. RSA 552]
MAIVRRAQTSFWDTVREAPRDWLLHLVEDYELIDWNRVAEATSWPCALALNALFVVVSLARYFSASTSNLDVLVDLDSRHRLRPGSAQQWGVEQGPDGGSSWAGVLLSVQVLLYLASIANTWLLFSSRRTYQLLTKEASTAAPSSSCRRVALGTRRPRWAHSLWGRVLWAVWRWVARVDDQIQGEVWELSLWTPPTFSRNLLCWYSPAQLLVMSFMDGSNWFYILPLAAAVAAQCMFIVLAYSKLVKDKQILFGEMYDEYNEKFVNPRVFAPTAEAATSTMEDWAYARQASSAQGPAAVQNGWRPAERPAARDVDDYRRRTTTALATEGGYRKAPVYSQEQTVTPAPGPRPSNSRDIGRRRNAFQTAHTEPAGSQFVRDRSARRRRHTEIIENAKQKRQMYM